MAHGADQAPLQTAGACCLPAPDRLPEVSRTIPAVRFASVARASPERSLDKSRTMARLFWIPEPRRHSAGPSRGLAASMGLGRRFSAGRSLPDPVQRFKCSAVMLFSLQAVQL